MGENEVATQERPAAPAAAPSTARPIAPSKTSGPLTLWRRIVGRRAPPPAIIEDDKGATIDVVAPRPHPPAYLISFIILVVIPSLATAIYFAFIASNQYVAEARFAVRTAQFETMGDKVKSALSNVGMSISMPVTSGQDVYIISTYIRSRGILDDLSKTLDLRAVFRRPDADFWARLKDHASTEELLAYWQGMVSAYIDGPSGIVTVSVRAFRPDDALALTKAVLTASEALANSVSARAREDAMRRAESETRRGEGMVVGALADLREFRDKSGIIDPISQATSTNILLTTSMAEKIKLQNSLIVSTRAMSPDAPTVQTMKTRLEELDRQIDGLKAKLTDGDAGAKTVSSVISRFEELEINRMFAEKIYESARDGLERAREKAEAQNIYVTVFVPPALPQEAEFPQRVSLSLLTPIGLMMLWGLFALIAASVEDHRL